MTSRRVALVTGASTGIGRAVAQRLLDGGFEVVAASRHAPEPTIAATDGREAVHVVADVAVEVEVQGAVAEVGRRFGRLDVVVNSAGYTKYVAHEDLDGISVEDWRRILDVNVIGAWSVVKAAVPMLVASDDAAVVNVSSMAGIRVGGSSLPYSVSKAALNQLTRTLARALGPRGIRVNAVAPGFVETGWTADYNDRRVQVAEIAPLRRTATPDDVAEAVVALLGAKYVTGEVLVVDGGLSLVD